MLYTIGFILLWLFIGLNVGRVVSLDHGSRDDVSFLFMGMIAWPLIVTGFLAIQFGRLLAFIFSSHFLIKYLCFYGDWFYKRFGDRL